MIGDVSPELKQAEVTSGDDAGRKMDVYLVEATEGGDQDLVRYYTQDKALFNWFMKGDVETPLAILERLLENKHEIESLKDYRQDFREFRLDNVNTVEGMSAALDAWLEKFAAKVGGATKPWEETVDWNVALKKWSLLEEGILPISDEVVGDDGEVKGLFRSTPGFTSSDFYEWVHDNAVNVVGVIEIQTGC